MVYLQTTGRDSCGFFLTCHHGNSRSSGGEGTIIPRIGGSQPQSPSRGLSQTASGWTKPSYGTPKTPWRVILLGMCFNSAAWRLACSLAFILFSLAWSCHHSHYGGPGHMGPIFKMSTFQPILPAKHWQGIWRRFWVSRIAKPFRSIAQSSGPFYSVAVLMPWGCHQLSGLMMNDFPDLVASHAFCMVKLW